jgi:hypothetical protein
VNWRLLFGFAGWCALCLLLFFIALVVTQMGDCFDVTACRDYKSRAGSMLWISGPLIWLAGTIFLFRRWSR